MQRKELELTRIMKIKDPTERATKWKQWGNDRIESYYRNPRYSIYTRFRMLDSVSMQAFITKELRQELMEELKIQMEYDSMRLKMKNFKKAQDKFQKAFDAEEQWAIKEILSAPPKANKAVMDAGMDFESLVNKRNKHEP